MLCRWDLCRYFVLAASGHSLSAAFACVAEHCHIPNPPIRRKDWRILLFLGVLRLVFSGDRGFRFSMRSGNIVTHQVLRCTTLQLRYIYAKMRYICANCIEF